MVGLASRIIRIFEQALQEHLLGSGSGILGRFVRFNLLEEVSREKW